MSKVNKIKSYEKRGISKLIIKSAKGQTLSEREVQAINTNMVPGLSPITVETHGKSFKLTYELTGLITLEDYLLTPMDRRIFAHLLQGILDVIHGMQKQYLSLNGLLLDTSKVFVNPAKRQFIFLYLPIQHFETGLTLRNFLLDVIQVGSFAQNEDTNYVQEYIKIINDGINFSVFKLEEYVKTVITGDGYRTITKIQCGNCKSMVDAHVLFCPICGMKLQDAKGDGIQKTYDPSAAVEAEKAQSDEDQEPGTTLLGDQVPKAAYLTRISTGERIYLNKPNFVIGKSASCDYTISGNTAISRHHSEIIQSGEHFEIKDLGSTNKTYHNGVQVAESAPLASGDMIKLANEEFSFFYG